MCEVRGNTIPRARASRKNGRSEERREMKNRKRWGAGRGLNRASGPRDVHDAARRCDGAGTETVSLRPNGI